MTRRVLHATLPGLIGVLAFALIWELVGRYRLAGMSWPPLTAVLGYMAGPGHAGLLTRAARATLTAVAEGMGIGCLAGLALALIVRLLRPARVGIDRLVALIHATPVIALAPVCMILLPATAIPPAIAALAVAYLIYVAATSGMEAAAGAHHDLFSVLGARPATRFWRLELPAALPALVSGLRLAIPVAFMGAIVGEWFGAARGLGQLMVSAMQNFQIPLLWAAVLVTVLASLLAYALMGLVEAAVIRRLA